MGRPRRGAHRHHRLARGPELLISGLGWSVRGVPSATPRGPFRKSGTEGSNPLCSSGESANSRSRPPHPSPCGGHSILITSAREPSSPTSARIAPAVLVAGHENEKLLLPEFFPARWTMARSQKSRKRSWSAFAANGTGDLGPAPQIASLKRQVREHRPRSLVTPAVTALSPLLCAHD